MIRIRKSLAISLVATLVLGGFPYAPSAAAQSQAACDAAIEKLERETQQLGRDLNADVRAAVKADVGETLAAGVRNHYKAKPASEAVFDLKEKWDNFKTYAGHIKDARVTMDELALCINTRGCSLIEFAKRQNEAIAKWIQTLGDDGLTAAAERVNKAGSLLRNYAERTLNTGINGAMDTVAKCNAKFEQQATSNTAQPVGQPNAPPPGGGSGSNVGKIVGFTALLGGSLIGGAYIASELAAISELDSGSSNTTTTNNNPAPVRETPSAVGLGTFRCGPEGEFHVGIRCEGAVNIRAGTRMAARQGAQLTIVTQPTTFIGRFVAPGLDGTTGTVQLRVDTFPSLCRAQTLVSFTADGNLFFETIQMSIPVTCR